MKKIIELDDGTFKNWLTYSVNQDGTDYRGDNGEDGYRIDYRYSASSKAEKSEPGYDCIGYIPVMPGDIVRITNIDEISTSTDPNGLATAYFFTTDFAQQGGAIYLRNSTGQIVIENGIYSFVVPTQYTGIRWMKLTLMGVTDNTIITLNQRIVSTHTNLFDATADGFVQESDTKFYTNYIPCVRGDVVHIKGATPYKYQRYNGTTPVGSLIYCTNAGLATSSYDSSVQTMVAGQTDANGTIDSGIFTCIRLEFRVALPTELIITVNKEI